MRRNATADGNTDFMRLGARTLGYALTEAEVNDLIGAPKGDVTQPNG